MKMLLNNTALFVVINTLDLIISMFLLFFPKKKDWQDYIICFYGGFLFGMVPLFVVLMDIAAAFVGCIFLSLLLLFLQRGLRARLYMPLGIVISKILLIAGIALFAEQYSLNMLNFYLAVLLAAVLLFLSVNMLCGVQEEWQHNIIRLFALLELSGVVLSFYRMDYTAFGKDLFSQRESVSFFLYLLKVDFEIFDYQPLYIMCFFALLFLWFAWKRVERYCKEKGRLTV